MKETTVIITCNRYINNQDLIVEIIYRADGWTVSEKKDESPVLNIWKDDKVIATHRTWDNIRYSDHDPIEKVTV